MIEADSGIYGTADIHPSNDVAVASYGTWRVTDASRDKPIFIFLGTREMTNIEVLD